jgi:hypothetical protein
MNRVLNLQKLQVNDFDDMMPRGCSTNSAAQTAIGRCSSCSIGCISADNPFQAQ